MAGSYKHVTTSSGHLRQESFTALIENLGDAHEAIEEMYGMIWYLASRLSRDPVEAIEIARQDYPAGLRAAMTHLGPPADEFEDDEGPDA